MINQPELEEIKIFTYDYIVELQRKIEIKEEFNQYIADSFYYEEKYPKGKTDVFIAKDFELKLPEKGNSFDLENSILLYENIKGLDPTIASDPRFWTYLVHARFWNYMRKRWPIENVENPKGRLINRYHVKYLKLETLTRNGLSRLWWYVHLTICTKYKDKFKLTRILLSRADIAVGLLERALGSNENIRMAVLEFLNENTDILKSEGLTRELFIQLNLIGGVKNLPFLTIDEIKEYLFKIKDNIIMV